MLWSLTLSLTKEAKLDKVISYSSLNSNLKSVNVYSFSISISRIKNIILINCQIMNKNKIEHFPNRSQYTIY